MNDTINKQSITKSLKLLTDGFKSEFATYVYTDEQTTELFSQLASEFVQANIPVIDDDNQIELALMLFESLNVTAR